MVGLLLGGIFWGIFGDKKEDFPYSSVPFLCILWPILPVDFYLIFRKSI
jgi:hypothetical protein